VKRCPASENTENSPGLSETQSIRASFRSLRGLEINRALLAAIEAPGGVVCSTPTDNYVGILLTPTYIRTSTRRVATAARRVTKLAS
jgi:hypothetical protein